jgi:hypothetical protein
MKKRTVLVATTLVCGWSLLGSLSAQTVLTPHFTEQSKLVVLPKDGGVSSDIREGIILIWYGYGNLAFVNTKGEYVFGTDFPISTINSLGYEDSHFSGGAALVYRKTGSGYGEVTRSILYPDGKYRDLPADISTASGFCDGYALVQKGQSVIMGLKQGFIDKNGKDVFPALTSTQKGTFGDMQIHPVRENRRVYYDAELKKYGYADEKGSIAIKPQFEKALSFSDGLAAVQVEINAAKKWGFIDTTGKLVIPAKYVNAPGQFSEGKAAVRIGDSSYDYEMTYIDKKGEKLMDNVTWSLNTFHNGFALVKKEVCDKLCVIDADFNEVRDITAQLTAYNTPDVCSFRMGNETNNDLWGIDFPGNTQALNTNGAGSGDIFAPDGTMIFKRGQVYYEPAVLYNPTEGGLIFCKVRMKDEPRLKEQDTYLQCFINQEGEIVLYFQEGVEGHEGPTPVQVKATPAAKATTKAPVKK